MDIPVELPQAFSVRDEHEFRAFQHLAARMNPALRVSPIGVGLHVEGGFTVYWGLVYLEGQEISPAAFDAALRAAGFHFGHVAAQLDDSLITAPRKTGTNAS